ncbi:MAG: hypothetical protein K2M55_02800, partial [Muribaculaceae bacterium]|nr:hypothetical protein [Muribaculaceae bacterium]
MKRLLLTLLVTICAAVTFSVSATYYKIQALGTSVPSGTKIYLATKSGKCTPVYPYIIPRGEAVPSSNKSYQCINVPQGFSCISTTYGSSILANSRYLGGVEASGDYYQLTWATGATNSIAKKYCSQYMSTEYRYDDDNLGYIVFTVKKTGIQYEYRCIDGKFYLVPLADEMPGERVYVAFETTKTTPSTITIKPKYSDGFPCSQNNSIVKSTDEEMSMSLGHTLGIRNEDLLSSCSVEGVDESYYSVDTEKGLITLSTDVPNGTELNFKIRRQAQVYEDKLLDSAFTSCKVYVSDNIKNVLWETSDGVSSTIQFNCNDYEKFSSEDGVMVPMANFNFDICGQACQKITELTPYIIDEEGNYKNAMPAGCDLVSVNGRLCILLKGMKDNLASTGHNWQFGNQPLTRDVEFWCCYCTADNVVIGEGRGFKTTITVVPYDLPDDIKPRFVDNLLFNADRDNELDFRTPGLYKNIHPEWGTWTAKITPAFEKKDQASLEAEYE